MLETHITSSTFSKFADDLCTYLPVNLAMLSPGMSIDPMVQANYFTLVNATPSPKCLVESPTGPVFAIDDTSHNTANSYKTVNVLSRVSLVALLVAVVNAKKRSPHGNLSEEGKDKKDVDATLSTNSDQGFVPHSNSTVLKTTPKRHCWWWHLNPNNRIETDVSANKNSTQVSQKNDQSALRLDNKSPNTNRDRRQTRNEKANERDQKDCTHYASSSMGVRRKLRRWIQRRHRKPKTSYRMAILATLAYWEFYKRPLPENAIGFRLRNDPTRMHACLVRQRIASIRYRMLKKLISWNPQISYWPPNEAVGLLRMESCPQTVSKKREKDRYQYIFDYWLYDWYEPSGVEEKVSISMILTCLSPPLAMVKH
jgi:hypothetical protein